MKTSPKTKEPLEYKAPGAHGVTLARGWLAACKPRERPPLSKFMVEHARSDDGARIRPFPFQADIADAFTDPETAQLSVRKSSRIGYSTILQCFVAWRIKFDPARTLIYQPTIDDAEKFSRDPLNKIIWTGHHYPTTTGNDQAKAGRSKPEIAGASVSAAIPAFFEGCKARSLKCMITEIGMGGGARGWLANGSGNPKFDGKAWFQQYAEIQSRYAGTVIGTITWGGGSAWKDDYAFKVEYGKDAWGQTPATEFFRELKQFWGR